MRLLDFSDGFSSALSPTTGSAHVVTGTTVSPTLITAAVGVTPSGRAFEIIILEGSPGAVDVVANPQVAAGTSLGQILYLVGNDDTNTVKLEDTNGLRLNGEYTMVEGSVLQLLWNGTLWNEVTRNDV